jgi:hypothetical protein
MNHLDQLESESVYILREAFNRIEKLAMLWSLGKDSNTMVWRLLRRAACARPIDQRTPGDRPRSSGSAGASAAYSPLKKLCSSRYVSSGACSEG